MRIPSLSIRNRLLFSFLALLLLPVITLGVIGPLIFSRSIETQVIDHTLRMISQVDKNLEYLVVNLEKLSSLLEATPSIHQFFMPPEEAAQKGSPQGPQVSAQTSALAFMDACLKTHKEIAGILLISADDRILTSHYTRITRDPLTLEPWYLKAVGSTQAVSIFSRPIGRNIRSQLGYGSDDVVSIVKPIRDPAHFNRVAGAILIDLRLESIQELLADSSLGRDGYLYISDQNGELVFAPVNQTIYRIAPRQLQGSEGRTLRRYGQEVFQILYKRSSYTGWTTAGVFSVQSVLREVSFIRLYALIVGSFTVFLAILLSVFFASSIALPVEKLRSLMKQAETGDFSIRFTENREDEIGQLGHSFNRMIEEISNLIDQVYQEQQRKRETELRVLQEQIKPHFLYNTLDTIQWMAQEHGARDIVDMVSALTQLFRVGLSKGQEMIPLREEFRHVESYLFIQKIRYEDKFDYTISIDAGLEQLRLLKVILQPLVENAIYHGIKERRGKGHIQVSAVREGNDILLTVEDDGIGMPADKLAQLQEELSSSRELRTESHKDWGELGHIGFGARNVHERIFLNFGPGYGITYSSTWGLGTRVTIRHPAIEG